jgi:hypothetical protein
LADRPYDDLKSAIGNRYTENSVKWLTDGSADHQKGRSCDILDNPNPQRILYVKGAQLVHAEQANMDATTGLSFLL